MPASSTRHIETLLPSATPVSNSIGFVISAQAAATSTELARLEALAATASTSSDPVEAQKPIAQTDVVQAETLRSVEAEGTRARPGWATSGATPSGSTVSVQLNGIVKDYDPPGGIAGVAQLNIDPTAQVWTPNTLVPCPQGDSFGFIVDGRRLGVANDPGFAPRATMGDDGFYATVRDAAAGRWFSTNLVALGTSGTAEPSHSTVGVGYDGNLCWDDNVDLGFTWRGARAPSTVYALNDAVFVDGSVWKAVAVFGTATSSSGTPAFASGAPNYGDSIIDGTFTNGVLWNRSYVYAGAWQPTTQYGAHTGGAAPFGNHTKVGADAVLLTNGKVLVWAGVAGTYGRTGSAEPAWGAATSTQRYWADGTVMWVQGRDLFGNLGDGTPGNLQAERLVLTGLKVPGGSGLLTITNTGTGQMDVVVADRDALLGALPYYESRYTDVESIAGFVVGADVRLAAGASTTVAYSAGSILFLMPVESVNPAAATASDPVEAQATAAATVTAPIESQTVVGTPVSQTAVLPIEALAAAAATTSDPVEALKPATTTASDPVEAIAPVPPATSTVPVEAQQGVAQTDATQVEALAAAAATASEPVEAQKAVAQTDATQLEALAAAAATGTDPVEAIAPVPPSTSTFPFEALRGIVQTDAVPVDAQAFAGAATAAALEALAATTSTTLDPVEAIAAVRATATLFWSALAAVSQTDVLPIEALGAPVIAVSQTAVLPIDAQQTVPSTELVRLEAVAAVAQPLVAVIEALAAALAAGADPLEAVGTVVATDLVRIDAQGAVAAARSVPLEGLAAVARTVVLAIEASSLASIAGFVLLSAIAAAAAQLVDEPAAAAQVDDVGPGTKAELVDEPAAAAQVDDVGPGTKTVIAD